MCPAKMAAAGSRDMQHVAEAKMGEAFMNVTRQKGGEGGGGGYVGVAAGGTDAIFEAATSRKSRLINRGRTRGGGWNCVHRDT